MPHTSNQGRRPGFGQGVPVALVGRAHRPYTASTAAGAMPGCVA
ncbi:hypothetical protein Q5762_06380 [Streptomyces sp. P9(2023)]|nr:hypothetical protein [Streptomyces sp. P9(2023)]MDT9687985.1 hypothetical protein [Streptomyces sp. P9(2023)]